MYSSFVRTFSYVTACLLCWAHVLAQGQGITVQSQVSGPDKEALEGAAVALLGHEDRLLLGATTDSLGQFAVTVPPAAQTLQVSYVGLATARFALSEPLPATIRLKAGNVLPETVITAIGISKAERSLGYAAQTVDGQTLQLADETNFVQSLAGKVAGLQVSQASGAAGGGSYFSIRGPNSVQGDNQPLIVVDGLPIDNSQLRSGSPLRSVAYSNRAIDLNTADIATVTVLKGAAATALYGSQAGNGAVLITTKQGAAPGKSFSVQFGQDLTLSTVSQLPELQQTYAQGIDGLYAPPGPGRGAQEFSYGPRLDTLRYTGDGFPYNGPNGSIVGQSDPSATDARVTPSDQRDFFQLGVSTQTSLALGATRGRQRVRFTLGYTHDEGVIPNNTFDKFNVGLNAETPLGQHFTLGANVQLIRSGGQRLEQGTSSSNTMVGLWRTPPSFHNGGFVDDPIADAASYLLPDGTQRNFRGGNGFDNPYWAIQRTPFTDEVNRAIASTQLTYAPTTWLALTYRPGIDTYRDDRRQHFARGSNANVAGYVFEDNYTVTRFNHDLFARASWQVATLGAELTAGLNERTYTLDRLLAEGRDFQIDDFYALANTSTQNLTSRREETRNRAAYASVDLNWRRLLYVSLTGRVEQESTLPGANNTFPYGSVSAGLVVSEWLNLPSRAALSYAKLRASVGSVGLGAPAYRTDTYYETSSTGNRWTNARLLQFPLAGVAGYSLSRVRGNDALTPERLRSFEVGTDIRLWQNRVSLDVTYYDNRSSDVILTVPIAASSGFDAQVLNTASISNRGIEVSLGAKPVSTSRFEWTVNAQFHRNRNLVERLADGIDNVFIGGFGGISARAIAGRPYSTLQGFGFHRDANGNRVIGPDGFPLASPNQRELGSALPDFITSLRNSLRFRAFSITAMWEWRQGGVMYNGTRGALFNFGTHQATADRRDTQEVFEGYTAELSPEGRVVFHDHDDDPQTPRIPKTTGPNTQPVLVDGSWFRGNGGGFGNNTEDFVEETTWLRLRDVSVFYALPEVQLGRLRVSEMRLGLTGRNLLLFTPYSGIDPDTNLTGVSNAQGLDWFNLPGTRSYSFDLQVTL